MAPRNCRVAEEVRETGIGATAGLLEPKRGARVLTLEKTDGETRIAGQGLVLGDD